jgi:tetratricopeptide (TPR) repeat protein
LKKYDDAIVYCRKCLDTGIQCGNKYAEAYAYSVLGDVYYSLKNYDDAISYSKKCIDIVKETDEDRSSDVIAYLTLGKANKLALVKYDEAVQNFKKCLEIATRIGDKQAKVRAYLNLGETYHSMKRYDDAVFNSTKCIGMAQETGEKRIEAEACLNLSTSYQSLNKKDDAILYGKKCIDVTRETGNRGIEAKACLNLSTLCQNFNEADDAILYGKKCLEVSQEASEKRTEMEGHLLLAQEYLGLFKLNDVFVHTDAGTAIAAELEDEKAKEKFTVVRASLYATVGMRDKANACDSPLVKGLLEVPTCSEKDLRETLDQVMKTSDKGEKYMAFSRLCEFYQSKHDYQKAINCIKQLKELDLGCAVNVFCFTKIGDLYMLMNRNDKALQCYQEGLPAAKTCTDKLTKSRFYFRIGQLYCILNSEFDLAEEYLREAIRSFEMVFASLGSQDEFKISIFDQYTHCYKCLSLVLIKMKQIKEALLVSDRCRARALRDLLISNLKLKQEVRVEEHIQYADIEAHISKDKFNILFYSVCFNGLLTFSLGAKKELQFSLQCFEIGEKGSLQLIDKAFDEMEVRHVINCEDRSLDMEKDIEDSRQQENEEESISLADRLIKKPVSLLTQLSLDSKREISGHENNEVSKTFALEDLFCYLISNAKLFMEQDDIVIIPDGPLYRVPFAALRDPDTGLYLSETKRIRLAPSIATLKYYEECPTDHHYKTDALIIGDPIVGKVMMYGEERDVKRLKGALEEAAEIALLLMVRPLLAQEATKPAVIKKLQQGVSVVHIAAHGILSKSTIVLAPSPETRATKIPDEEDYMLTMADVQKAQIRAQLVVLSCCHSGRGEIRAEGVVGMCRAFLASGARAVVASLWAIDDQATLEFMRRFYRNLREGKSASTSLQQTMKEMRNSSDYDEPGHLSSSWVMT